jgi:hypothetical protein
VLHHGSDLRISVNEITPGEKRSVSGVLLTWPPDEHEATNFCHLEPLAIMAALVDELGAWKPTIVRALNVRRQESVALHNNDHQADAIDGKTRAPLVPVLGA